MKRVVGLAAAAYSVFMTGEAMAQPVGPAECAPVYEEGNAGYISPQLSTVIDEYSDNGVEVHVQILEDGTDEGVTREGNSGGEQLEEYARNLVVSCNWESEDLINVAISRHPRAKDIRTYGSLESEEIDRAIEEDNESYVSDLRDFDTPFQDDVAQMLRDISPFRSDAQPNTGSNESSDGSSPELPDIPWGAVIVGSLGLAAVSASGARLYKGHKMKVLKDDILLGPTQLDEELGSALLDTHSILDVLPQDDAATLRSLYDELVPKITVFDETKDGLDAAYRSERKRVWPDLNRLAEAARPVLGSFETTKDLLEALKAETSKVNQRVLEIDGAVLEFQELLSITAKEADALVADGWDLQELPKTGLGEYWDVLSQVQELRKERYADKPGDILSTNHPQLESLFELLKNLPDRLGNNSESVESISVTAAALPGKVGESVKEFADLKTKYHPECTESMGDIDSEMQGQLSEIEDINERLSKMKGVKSLDITLESEALQARFRELAQGIENSAVGISALSGELVAIEESIPAILKTIETESLETAEEVSVEPEDIEEDTREQIAKLGDAISSFKESEINTDKPRLLTISKGLDEFKEKIVHLREAARSERAEMQQLRIDIPSASDELEDKLRELREYIDNHDSDISESIENAVQGFDIPDSSGSSRSALRSQREALANKAELLGELQDKAQDSVREAERERERQRERARQRSMSNSISSGGINIGGGGRRGGSGGGGGGRRSGGKSHSSGW